MKILIKKYLYQVLGSKKYMLILAILRKRNHSFQKKAEFQYELINKYGSTILSGPFKGMNYPVGSIGSVWFSKLLGTYEQVLHEEIKLLLHEDFDQIIDVGCAEGYYLVGMGIQSKAQLVGFDIDPEALVLCKALYDANKSNISGSLSLELGCSHKRLQEVLTKKTLLICDAEGYEKHLLNPTIVNDLKNVLCLMIETHDIITPGISDIIKKRFQDTHEIKEVQFQEIRANDYPEIVTLPESVKDEIIKERDDSQQTWLFLRRRD